MSNTKLCKGCEESLPITEFRTKPNGYIYPRCIPCEKLQRKAYDRKYIDKLAKKKVKKKTPNIGNEKPGVNYGQKYISEKRDREKSLQILELAKQQNRKAIFVKQGQSPEFEKIKQKKSTFEN